MTTEPRAARAASDWQPPRRLPVALLGTGYDIVIGAGLLARAGALAGRRRCRRSAPWW